MNESEKIIWTKEQEDIIGTMINESEGIGYTQGYDEAIKEIIRELEKFIFELKKKVYINKDESRVE
jgi:hypothetical protein